MRYSAVIAAWTVLLAAGCDSSPAATEGPPAALTPEIIQRNDGDQQRAEVGMPLPRRLSVRVLTAGGRPVGGVPVQFAVNGGGGWVVDRGQLLTDASGGASTVWYMGPAMTGTHLLTAFSPAGAVTFRADVLELEPGQSYNGADGYIELRVGTLPLIISAGRGGTLTPAGIADRGTGMSAGHLHTAELVDEIVDAFRARGSGVPSVLISRLDRRKMDPDVELPGGGAVPAADRAWREYHGFLTAARSQLQRRFGRGLYLDVHGSSHATGRVEIGYLLTAADLALNDAALDQLSYVERSSIRTLALDNHRVLSQVVRGPGSLGALLEARGQPAMPGPSAPVPAHEAYAAGGLSTRLYGSSDGSPVSAVLLELPLEGVRDTGENRRRFAEVLVEALDAYFTEYYGAALTSDFWQRH